MPKYFFFFFECWIFRMSLSGKTAAKTSLKKHVLSHVKGSKQETIFMKFKVMVYLAGDSLQTVTTSLAL